MACHPRPVDLDLDAAGHRVDPDRHAAAVYYRQLAARVDLDLVYRYLVVSDKSDAKDKSVVAVATLSAASVVSAKQTEDVVANCLAAQDMSAIHDRDAQEPAAIRYL